MVRSRFAIMYPLNFLRAYLSAWCGDFAMLAILVPYDFLETHSSCDPVAQWIRHQLSTHLRLSETLGLNWGLEVRVLPGSTR